MPTSSPRGIITATGNGINPEITCFRCCTREPRKKLSPCDHPSLHAAASYRINPSVNSSLRLVNNRGRNRIDRQAKASDRPLPLKSIGRCCHLLESIQESPSPSLLRPQGNEAIASTQAVDAVALWNPLALESPPPRSVARTPPAAAPVAHGPLADAR